MGRYVGNAVVLTAFTLFAACASTGTAARHEDCPLSPADSTYLMRGAVYRDCAVDEKARLLTTNLHPDFRPPTEPTGCFAAEVEFVVDTAGVPEPGSTRLVRETTREFGDAVVALVPRLRFTPARLGGSLVRQIVEMRRAVTTTRPPNC
jgi:hypothetical protein